MSATSESVDGGSVDVSSVSCPSPRPISETMGFALGVAGAAAVALLLRDWWGVYLYSDALGTTHVHSSYNFAKVLLLLGLVITVFGWWLTSRGKLLRSVVLTLSKSVATVGCVLAGVGALHLISARVPRMFGISVPSYRTTWTPWSFDLKYDVLPVVFALISAGIGFAIVRRIDRTKG